MKFYEARVFLESSGRLPKSLGPLGLAGVGNNSFSERPLASFGE